MPAVALVCRLLEDVSPYSEESNDTCNRHYSHNRVVDCTMEILSFLKKYMENQEL